MLNRLVRGPVFAQANTVVGKHMHHALFHQRGHADSVAAVVAKGQKGAAVGDKAAMQRDAVHDGGHAKLAHTVVNMAAQFAVGIALYVACSVNAQGRGALGVGQVRPG